MRLFFIVNIIIVSFLLSGCISKNSSIRLENNHWKALSVKDKKILESERREVSMLFSKGVVKGSSGCNGLGGRYTLDGNKLSFSDKGFMTTRMFCKDSIEPEFLKALKQVDSYKIYGDNLELYDKNNRLLIKFELKNQ